MKQEVTTPQPDPTPKPKARRRATTYTGKIGDWTRCEAAKDSARTRAWRIRSEPGSAI